MARSTATPGRPKPNSQGDDTFHRILQAYDAPLCMEKVFVPVANEGGDHLPFHKYVSEMAYGLCVPNEYMFPGLFSATSSASGRFFVRASDGWLESTNVWIMMAGKPGARTRCRSYLRANTCVPCAHAPTRAVCFSLTPSHRRHWQNAGRQEGRFVADLTGSPRRGGT
jgi:hypothetical protein